MSVQTQGLVVGEEGDRRAAQMAAVGATLGQIAAKFDPPLSIEHARAAVERGRRQVSDRTPKPAPTPKPQLAQEQRRSVPLEPDELLAWAEKEGPARARALAAKVRAGLADLTQLHDQHAATDVLRKTIAVLERQLAAAKDELRQKTGSKSKVRPAAEMPSQETQTADPESKEGRLLIREWAREQGYPVAERGLIGSAIVEAYQRAHTETAGGPS